MIELRWLDRVVERGGSGLDAWARTECVLQYRQQLMLPVGGWIQGENPQRRPEWTPWTDVPTVREA